MNFLDHSKLNTNVKRNKYVLLCIQNKMTANNIKIFYCNAHLQKKSNLHSIIMVQILQTDY